MHGIAVPDDIERSDAGDKTLGYLSFLIFSVLHSLLGNWPFCIFEDEELG